MSSVRYRVGCCGGDRDGSPAPEACPPATPFLEQIPNRCREMFLEGCDQANIESSPVILEGMFEVKSELELFRAVFMPILLQPNWSKRLILGSFNYRPASAK